MNLTAPLPKNTDRPLAGMPVIAQQSAATTQISRVVRDQLGTVTPAYQGKRIAPAETTEERLFEVRAQFKILISQVAMHLPDEWRLKLFAQLDRLLDLEQWESEDLPPKLGSFQTLIRMLLLFKARSRPGLGATQNGNMVAAWTRGDSRLTVECLERDQVRWSLSTTIDGDRIRAAGQDTLPRLPVVLAAYQPHVWFTRAE